MISMARPTNFAPPVDDAVGATNRAAAKRAGFPRRIFDAVMAARQRQVDRHMARFIDRAGGRLTDDIEREMTRCQTAAFGNQID